MIFPIETKNISGTIAYLRLILYTTNSSLTLKIYINPEDARTIPRAPGQFPVDLSKLLQVKEFVFKYEYPLSFLLPSLQL